MSTSEAASWTIAVILLLLAAAIWLINRWYRPYKPAQHDVGPDPLLLLDELTAHLKAYGAEIADLYEPVHSGDHTTTNPTGDQ